MRVNDRNPLAPLGGASGIQRSGVAGSRFSLNGSDGPGRASSAQSAAPAGALDGMIALQAAGDALERRKKAVRRGKGLLDTLDQLKISILSGRISPQQLENLKTQMKSHSDNVDDPGLADVLAHIELRAAVELAKLGRG
jgi:Class II flagellar assembly regulator